ncbi:hypothetical protein B0H14DRAFT_3448614 [Mycena olivaceomarginata]|nr:hypothetical protein B0H14DRAFT_3448614 [Mycena olivaceomarginata]
MAPGAGTSLHPTYARKALTHPNTSWEQYIHADVHTDDQLQGSPTRSPITATTTDIQPPKMFRVTPATEMDQQSYTDSSSLKEVEATLNHLDNKLNRGFAQSHPEPPGGYFGMRCPGSLCSPFASLHNIVAHGVHAIVKIFKRVGTPCEVRLCRLPHDPCIPYSLHTSDRMKCLEFLYFYLLDEMTTSLPAPAPATPTPTPAPTAPSAPRQSSTRKLFPNISPTHPMSHCGAGPTPMGDGLDVVPKAESTGLGSLGVPVGESLLHLPAHPLPHVSPPRALVHPVESHPLLAQQLHDLRQRHP